MKLDTGLSAAGDAALAESVTAGAGVRFGCWGRGDGGVAAAACANAAAPAPTSCNQVGCRLRIPAKQQFTAIMRRCLHTCPVV